MVKSTLISLVGFSFLLSRATASNPCGATGSSHWVAYEDSKCFKVMKSSFVTRNNAKTLCASEDTTAGDAPILPIITSQKEQTFLTNLIFGTLGIVENVWIGAKRLTDAKFEWEDGSPITFDSWAPGSPTNIMARDCVVMKSELTTARNGEWSDVSCVARNAVVCQKLQGWSIADLQQQILKLKANLEGLNAKLEQVSSDLQITKEQIVPIGFIYVQISTERSPLYIWPTMTWQDVSVNYAGLFFRVVGGGAQSIGTVQEDNSPRLVHANYTTTREYNWATSVDIPEHGWSSKFRVGSWYNVPQGWDIIQFRTHGGEVRPRNTAMKIWRRVH